MMRILTIDDSQFICNMIKTILSSDTIEVYAAQTGEDALRWVDRCRPDLVLLNLVLPDMDGYSLCVKLIQEYDMSDTPILFLTSTTHKESILRGFEAGAADYITKPFSPAELRARVSSHLKIKRYTDELRIANQKLQAALAEIRLQEMRDPLTHLYNRRYFLENMENWRNFSSRCTSFIVLIDIDDFKNINDLHGHCAGDYALYTVADILQNVIGDDGVAGRWGGDEFLVILFQQTEQKARELLERTLETIKQKEFCYDGEGFDCHITMGMSRFDPSISIESNIERADEALYEGKRNGKNGYVFHNMWG